MPEIVVPRLAGVASYVPPGRLATAELRRHWPGAGGPAGVRSVAVAGFDEDVVTMAVEAIDELAERTGFAGEDIDGLVVATCSAPYAEHSVAAEVARALALPRDAALVDLAGSVRGGVLGVTAAAAGVAAGRWRRVVVVAADARRGEPGTPVEALGAGAAAALVSSEGGVVIGDWATWRHGVPTRWRPDGARAVRSYDDARYERDEVVVPAARGVLAALGVDGPAFAAGGFTDARSPAAIGRACGLDASTDLGDDEVATLGDLGSAGPLVTLAHCLERAGTGAAGISFAVEPGAGADAVALEVEGPVPVGHRRPPAVDVDYVAFLRRAMVLEPAAIPPIVPWSSTPGALRDDNDGALVGAECRTCGSVNIPPRPVCVDCGGRTLVTRSVPRRGAVVTHNRQHVVAVHPEPSPVSVGVARITGLAGERGGQVSAMFCDSDLDEVRVGSPVELVYRRLGVDDGLVKYGWKMRLCTEPAAETAS